MLNNIIQLYSFCNANLGKPFTWEKNNCFMLFACIYDRILKTNYISIAKQYNTKNKALKGFKTKEMYKILNNNFKKIDRTKLKIGDIIYTNHNGVEGLRIYLGDAVFTCDEANGIYVIKEKDFFDRIGKITNPICFAGGLM
jgi:hypothetical protein